MIEKIKNLKHIDPLAIIKSYAREMMVFCIFIATYIPTLIWMWDRWFARDSYYTHGILVPFLTIALIWMKREELKNTSVKESPWGFVLILIGLSIHLLSSVLRIYFTSGFSMVIVLVGMVLYFFGEEVFKKILFPISFLVFMIPLPMVMITNISFNMKIFAAELATIILNNMRLPAIREGSIIKMRSTYVIVDDVCSGLRSLISLLALGGVFAYGMKAPMIKRMVLFLSTIPIAIITNVCRVILLSAISEIWGSEYATGFIHDFSGFMVFGLAFILLFAVGKLLE